MGILSKIGKSFKKIVKKVGRGIKKIAKKVGKVIGKIAKPFQKLGIVGQLALGFIMPWAIGSTFSYLTGSAFSSTIAGLTGPGANIFQKAVGYTFQGIQMAANGIKGAYNTVSGAINGAFDYVGEKIGDFGDWIKGNVEKDPMNITQDVPNTEVISTKDVPTEVVKDTVKKEAENKTFFETAVDAAKEIPDKLKTEITEAPTKIAEKITSAGIDYLFDRDENEYGYSSPYVADFSNISEPSRINKEENIYNSNGLYYNTPAAILQGAETTYRGNEWNAWFTQGINRN